MIIEFTDSRYKALQANTQIIDVPDTVIKSQQILEYYYYLKHTNNTSTTQQRQFANTNK